MKPIKVEVNGEEYLRPSFDDIEQNMVTGRGGSHGLSQGKMDSVSGMGDRIRVGGSMKGNCLF